jgi:hypothetical protein
MAFDLNENSSVEDVFDWLNSNGFEDFSQTFHGMYIFIFNFAWKFQIRPATWPNSDDKNFRIFICLCEAIVNRGEGLEGRQTSKASELINFRCWKGTSRDISGASNSEITIA